MRVGLFGGTFDPIHVGHLMVAQDVLEALELDHVRFVVAARSPLKLEDDPASAVVRAEMAEAAVDDDPHFRVSRTELGRSTPSYTVDTLRTLREEEPGTEWFLVVGSDQLADFAEWKEPAEVARLATLVVVAREGTTASEVALGADVPYETVPVTRVDVSSTGIRQRIRAGRSVRYLVPEAVRRIIDERGLYR